MFYIFRCVFVAENLCTNILDETRYSQFTYEKPTKLIFITAATIFNFGEVYKMSMELDGSIQLEIYYSWWVYNEHST